METNCESEAKTWVCFVGPNHLQNKLLASFLEEESGTVECSVLEELPEAQKCWMAREVLILLDSQNRDPFGKSGVMNEIPQYVLNNCLVALFNVPPGNGNEHVALKFGIRGIFLSNASPDDFRKAIVAILSGELWYPRRTVAEWILKNSMPFVPPDKDKPRLTTREREILLKLASGASNKKMAAELFISPHTVRTHLYNIFKKIDVESRFEASLWAAKNL